MPHYGSVKSVRTYAGITPQTLDLGSDVDLDMWIENKLTVATDLINRNRNRDFKAEGDVPPAIHDIANRMVWNLITSIQQRRASPVVRVDDFTVEHPEQAMLTKGILQELRQFPRKLEVRFLTVPGPETENDNGGL